MQNSTSSLIRFISGFILALIGSGIIINNVLVGQRIYQLGAVMLGLGFLLLFTSKFHLYFWKKEAAD